MTATLNFLQKTGKYYSPQEIRKAISNTNTIGYTVGFPTVYRIPERLLNFDHIVPMFSKRSQTLYYLCRLPDDRHHHHFFCTRCRQIREISRCFVDGFKEYVQTSLNASMTGSFVQIEGLCSRCRTKENAVFK